MTATSSPGAAPSSMAPVLAMIGVTTIFGGQFVAAKYLSFRGVPTADLVAMRYLPAGIVLLPFLLFYRPWRDRTVRHWKQALVLTALAGFPYGFQLFGGLFYAPASHGAIFNPSSVLIFSALMGWWFVAEPLGRAKTIGIGILIVGLVLVSWDGFLNVTGLFWVGDIIFIAAGVIWSTFLILLKVWAVPPIYAAAVTNVLSLVYLPVYLFVIGPNIGNATVTDIVFQSVYQGLLVQIGALSLFAYAVSRIGASGSALFTPLVPTMTMILALLILGERPSLLQWTGFGIICAGFIIATGVLGRRAARAA